MAAYVELWDRWMTLGDDASAQDLKGLVDDVYASLAVSQSQSERGELAAMLATVQNALLKKAEVQTDRLAEVLRDLD